jgi:hypothetical protein
VHPSFFATSFFSKKMDRRVKPVMTISFDMTASCGAAPFTSL